jgi:protocatechuate 3,4-dioxygenase, beta subunit
MVSRRSFIGLSCLAMPALCLLPRRAPETGAPLNIACRDEPGRPIIVAGRVYDEDGRTPLREALLYVYHTDDAGYYSKPRNDPRTARINSWVPVHGDGSYSFRTILPGHYVVDNPPARHIHVHLSAPGVPDHWIDSFLFAGDPRLTQEQLTSNAGMGARSAIMTPVRRAGGVVYYQRDIRLDQQLAERNRLVNGWYRNP